MTAGDFTRIALSFDGAEQGSHMGAVDFRVGGRIFASLASVAKGFGNVMISPEQQREFVAELPDVFVPVAGKWGEARVTHIRLEKASAEIVRGALHAAWKRRVAANEKSRPPRPRAKTKTPRRK